MTNAQSYRFEPRCFIVVPLLDVLLKFIMISYYHHIFMFRIPGVKYIRGTGHRHKPTQSKVNLEKFITLSRVERIVRYRTRGREF